jgi:tetratricopeptide (TPR) repeat protein
MRRALEDPTENALAQAEWARSHGLQNPAIVEQLNKPLAFEARALAFSTAKMFVEAAAEGTRWQRDQPFAPEPAVFTSYIAAVALEDYSLAIEVARRGLVSNPDDVALRNNLVFSLASAGHPGEARAELASIGHVPEEPAKQATLLATRGLVAFREGRPDEGRAQYRTATEMLRRHRHHQREALAMLLWAREELFSNSDLARDVRAEALAIAADVTAPEVRLWAERLMVRPPHVLKEPERGLER